eukprot:4765511-Amphidinium_carterae.1
MTAGAETVRCLASRSLQPMPKGSHPGDIKAFFGQLGAALWSAIQGAGGWDRGPALVSRGPPRRALLPALLAGPPSSSRPVGPSFEPTGCQGARSTGWKHVEN